MFSQNALSAAFLRYEMPRDFSIKDAGNSELIDFPRNSCIIMSIVINLFTISERYLI